MWRVLTHERAPTKDILQIESQWTITKLLDANLALDVWDDIERNAQDEAERERKEAEARAEAERAANKKGF